MPLSNSHAQSERLRAIGAQGAVGLLRHGLAVALEIHGPFDKTLLKKALDEIIARHPALRAEFSLTDTEHHRIIADLHLKPTVNTVEGGTEQVRLRQAHAMAEAQSMRRFDVTRAPLIEVALLALDPGRHMVVLAVDQLICDAWSVNLVVDELVTVADHLARGVAPPAAVTDEYVRVSQARAEWLAGPEGHAAVERRRAALRTATPWWPWRPMPDSDDPDLIADHFVDLPDAVARTLFTRVRKAGGSLLSVGAAALAAAANPQPETRLAIRSTFACRESIAQESVVGWLSNDVVIALPPLHGTVAKFIGAIRAELIAGLNDQLVPGSLAMEMPEDADSAAGVSISLLYLPTQLSGGRQAAMRIGAATVNRSAVAICPTGADVDLFMIERPPPRGDGERPPLLRLGAISRRTRVGAGRLGEILAGWQAALERIGSMDWQIDGIEMAGPHGGGRATDPPHIQSQMSSAYTETATGRKGVRHEH